MERPLPGDKAKKRAPSAREIELEAEGFMALYAQVTAG
jgi:hypothetical protein